MMPAPPSVVAARRSRSRSRSRSRAGEAGFTLIEAIVAISILAMVVGLTWGSFYETQKAKTIVEANSQRYHSVRLALERISRELTMAYLSQAEDVTMPERRTFFIGKRKGDIDEVRFSYFGHQRLYVDANEADTAQVSYYGQTDRQRPGKLNLVRRETRRLSNLKMEQAPGRSDIVCDDVVSVHLDYWDARDKTLREEWSTLSADGQVDRLPTWVRITMIVRDERGREVPFATKVRLPIQEPLNLKPRTL